LIFISVSNFNFGFTALDNENKHGRGPSPKRHTSSANSHISITIVKGQIASQEVCEFGYTVKPVLRGHFWDKEKVTA
jgi:hypothetical protein